MGGATASLIQMAAKRVALFCLAFFWESGLWSAPVSQAVKLDHFGYRTADTKVAIFTTDPGPVVEVRDTENLAVFLVPADGGSITDRGSDGAPSGDHVWWVDFTAFDIPGSYRLYSSALDATSYDFDIRDDIYNVVVQKALNTFYLQRCNTPKVAALAGAWADSEGCHADDAATGPASGHSDHGSLDLTGGWHDAGDYNKYVWSAVSTAVLFMLRAFEDNPGVFLDGDLAIPESSNGIPDLLDEIKWELDWLLRMQLPSGEVLSQMHVTGFAADSPPSADENLRFYQNPNEESGAVLAGTCAMAARIFAAQGLTTYAATLRTAALETWTWLETQGDSEIKVWAAAEIFRLDPSVTSARSYVDGFYAAAWAGRFFNVMRYDTHAALTYVSTAGASAAVVTNMKENIGDQVDYIFDNDDLYRNGMPSWSYYWGSSSIRAGYGVFLLQAARMGETGSHTAAECVGHAEAFLHYFHGQNALNMVYLTNMAALGGEHSSFQLYHAWFGDSENVYSRDRFVGKPPAVVEPDYPYFKGIDNHGVSDDKTSTLGPAPGFVTGGPNKDYGGDASPPLGAVYYNRFYRDWNDQEVWTARTWEITENSIGYQGPYVALGAYFMQPQPKSIFTDGFESGDTTSWSSVSP